MIDLYNITDKADRTARLTAGIVDACLDARGKDITVLDIGASSDVADYYVVVSARSDRQVQGIGNKILSTLDTLGIQPDSIEGYETGHWLLIDFADVIVHVFYEPVREHYDLEALWINAERWDVDEREYFAKVAA